MVECPLPLCGAYYVDNQLTSLRLILVYSHSTESTIPHIIESVDIESITIESIGSATITIESSSTTVSLVLLPQADITAINPKINNNFYITNKILS